MSVFYTIDITLNIRYTEENIKYVLTRGTGEGFIYFEDILPFLRKPISIEKVIQKFLRVDSESGEKHIITKFQDTSFFIWFNKAKHDLLLLTIGGFGSRWDREATCGSDMYTIDFARYIRLILDICEDTFFVEMNTFSDLLDNIVHAEKNCIVAVIELGSFQEVFDGSQEGAKGSIRYVIRNGIQNNFIFLDEIVAKTTDLCVEEFYEILKAGFPIYFSAKLDDVPFTIEIKRNVDGYDFLSVYPLEPYRMKKGYGSEEEKIDLAFYIKRLIELCENFAIYELKTFI